MGNDILYCNFAFMQETGEYAGFADDFIEAEKQYAMGSWKLCVAQCRAAMEAMVKWIYSGNSGMMKMPSWYDPSGKIELYALLDAMEFQKAFYWDR